MKKIVASIQVRMGSSRYPGKVMQEICGKPMIEHLINRLQYSIFLDDIVIATSTNKENDVIEKFCISKNITFYRGSEDDVLLRTFESLKKTKAQIGVEVFGDCPLIDYRIVDKIISRFLKNKNLDFISNDLKTTFSPGMEVEVFSIESLDKANSMCNDSSIREHGTLFIRKNPEIFNIENISATGDLLRPSLELEFDTAEDFMVISNIFNHFHSKNKFDFSLIDIINYLDKNPRIRKLNSEVPRRWKKARDE